MNILFFELIGFTLFILGYRGIHFMSVIIGTIAFDVFKYKKRIILYNIDIVYGDSLTSSQKINLGRRSIINYATTILETMASKRLFRKGKVKIINEENLKKILSYKSGIYFAGIHSGNTELMNYFGTRILHMSSNLIANVNHGIFEKFLLFLRKKYTHNINKMNKIEKDISAPREIFAAIDRKEVVCFAIDHKRPRADSVLFFERLTLTNNTLARVYFKKKAPIFPVILKRKKPGYFEIEFFDEVVFHRNENLSLKENITQLTAQLSKVSEKMILKCPEEYWWWRNRWEYTNEDDVIGISINN